MFTLLDAAESGRLIPSADLLTRWITLSAEGTTQKKSSAEEYFRMLMELEEMGALKGSWIGERWAAVRSRITRGKY